VNARIAALLTALHGPAWRRRYGTEFHALLEELPATPDVVVSAAGSAFTSRAPALAAIGALALAAAVLALGPVASDREAIATANVACATHVAQFASDGNSRC
jgi:hypothetical protein